MMKKLAKGFAIGCGAILLLTVVAIVCFVVWFFNSIDDSLSKEEIFKLVNNNYSIILDDISENDFEDTKKLKGVKEVDPDTEIVDFYCGGKGLGSSTSYYGFYYSPDGLPKCRSDFGRIELLEPDGNGFSIKYYEGDNRYYTEKIRDNFYYYEAHF